MSDTPAEDPRADSGSPDRAGDPEADLARLRRLLIGEKLDRVERLEADLRDPERLAEVLPQAIRIRSEQDERLAAVLQPTIESSMERSVKKNPQVLIDVIFPVIGPAIRKAITQAMSGLVQAINRSVEATFTPRGLRWRFEAWRTGRAYAEVVLAHSVVYRVEQLFLIHSDTGLLLQQVVVPELETQDPDLVSSMLTAIQDFVRDSFQVKEGAGLDQFRVGELLVLVERGPRAVLASVVRGVPPADLTRRLQEAVELVHEEQREDLETFEGDTGPFESVRPVLEDCLLVQERPKKKSLVAPLLLTALLLAIVTIFLVSWLRSSALAGRWDDYLARLDAAPGLVVVRTERRGGRLHLTGLRDPLAADPDALRTEADLAPDEVEAHWEPYTAHHEAFVLERVRALRPLTEGTDLALRDGVLVVTGAGADAWLQGAADLARLVPGVRMVARETAAASAVDVARGEVEAKTYYFAADATLLSEAESVRFDELLAALRRLDTAALVEDRRFRVDIVGHAGPDVTATEAERLSLLRAQETWGLLQTGPWERLTFEPRGVGAEVPYAREGTPRAEAGPDRVTFGVVEIPE